MPVEQELLQAYRALLGGAHDQRARDCAASIPPTMPQRDLTPRPLSCLRYLDRTAECAPDGGQAAAQLLARHGSSLHWGQTYNAGDFGQYFLERYGWIEVFGERGMFANADAAGGFLLLAPEITYPDHHHLAEEIYIPLTGGTLWKQGEGEFTTRAAGEVIYHSSNMNHAMKTLGEPLLALYFWRGGPLSAKSTIGATS